MNTYKELQEKVLKALIDYAVNNDDTKLKTESHLLFDLYYKTVEEATEILLNLTDIADQFKLKEYYTALGYYYCLSHFVASVTHK